MQMNHGTKIALAAVAGIQSAGGVCAWVDCVGDLDTNAVTAAGVNLGDLLISQPDNRDQAIEIVDTLVRTGAIDLVVITGVHRDRQLASWSRYATLVLFVGDA